MLFIFLFKFSQHCTLGALSVGSYVHLTFLHCVFLFCFIFEHLYTTFSHFFKELCFLLFPFVEEWYYSSLFLKKNYPCIPLGLNPSTVTLALGIQFFPPGIANSLLFSLVPSKYALQMHLRLKIFITFRAPYLISPTFH